MDVRELLEGVEVDLVGVADVERIKDAIHPSLKIDGLKRAIVIGFRINEAVLDTIEDKPTLLYKHHYKVVNWMLDQTAYRIARRIEARGYRAIPIAASQEIDWKHQLGHLPHKVVGLFAGLGWIGKSGLLINPELGPRVRYATILTDMPLKTTEKRILYSCGTCTACIDSCPAKAIDDTGYDWEKCYSMLKKYAAIRGIGQLICGICVKVCPVGRNKGPF